MDLQELWDRLGEGANGLTEGVNKGLLKVFGNSNERIVRRLRPKVELINALEPKMQALSDEDLKGVTPKLRERLAKGETLDDILVDAFAAAREAGKRFLRMRHFDVQLLGGMVLHSGRIAEMVTGEGKTLVATLPAYLNALAGKGVHVVTVNDYLARRDAEWMSPLYTALGLTVGAIQSDMDSPERQHHYGCDITYGTNNEFGFDYLRDNMKPTRDMQCQRELFFALIDEVDSVLIDEARTPLIISGPAIDDPTKYSKANRIAMQLKPEVHFEVREKEHTCHLTDQGILEAEKLVGVESFYTAGNMEWPHLLDNALKAQHLYRRDKEYMVRTGEVIIIDEHTGRAMEGRQWSDGLHQAVEAKEGVRIKEETQTLATITFQNFFKLYKKLGGMTGTAMTEANEFYKIYKLDVVAIPTNRALIRQNSPDLIFCTEKEKWKAIIDEVKTVRKTRRPMLIGTTSVEKSEFLSEMFRRNGIPHEVLNAKNVEREAEIVAQAGRLDAITISTNMAGRGTDIVLGGNPEIKAWAELKANYATRLDVPAEVWRATVAPLEEPMKIEGREVAAPRATIDLAKMTKTKRPEELAAFVEGATKRQLLEPERLVEIHSLTGEDKDAIFDLVKLYQSAHPGGLHIVGTERHESRRIDNQLRGRSGRQGDPGSSRFFLSLEDDLMRIFAGDWVKSILQRLGMQEGESIESRMVSRRIEAAQKKVEERNFEIRKSLLEYDEIMDTQRKRVYGYRQNILDGADCKALIVEMIDRQIDKAVKSFLSRDYGTSAFAAWVSNRLGVDFEAKDFSRCDFVTATTNARNEAARNAESMLIDAVDEHLNEEVDEREWNWEAITGWVNGRWDLDLKAYDLKRIGRADLSVYLSDQIRKAIDKIGLEGGEEFFTPNFGLLNLVGWANQKFALGLALEDVPQNTDDAIGIAKVLKEKARGVYSRKEAEFPVYCGLSRFYAEKAAGQGARYDREGLLNWAISRFEAQINLEEFRNLPRQETISRLLEVSERFYRNGAWYDETRQQMSKLMPANAQWVDKPSQAAVASWVSEHLRQPLDFENRNYHRDEIERVVIEAAEHKYRPELHEAERSLVLQFLDIGWKDHLYAMDHLKSGIGLVGYAQIDPKVEYKRKGKTLFEEMWDAVEGKVTDLIFRIEEADTGFASALWQITNAVHESAGPTIATAEAAGGIRNQQDAAIEMSKGEKKVEPIRNRGDRIGRNDPCPCGSGKKYKNCCMAKNKLAG